MTAPMSVQGENHKKVHLLREMNVARKLQKMYKQKSKAGCEGDDTEQKCNKCAKWAILQD